MKRVVIYKLKSDESLSSLANQLSDDMLLHLGKKSGLSVVGEDEIQVMLSHEKDKEALLCDDEQRCLAKLNEAINADKVITGHLGRIGESYLVTLKLADAARAVVEGASQQRPQSPGARCRDARSAGPHLGRTREQQGALHHAGRR